MDNQTKGLYDARFEHDACGIGAVISIKGRQEYKVVDDALKIVEKLETGNASLDECIKLYEQGVELSSKCVKFLEEAEQKIKIISQTNDIKED